MPLVDKAIAIRIDQELWVQENVKDGEFTGLVRDLLDEHIRQQKVVEKALGVDK